MNTNENSFERGFERGFKAGVESTKATPPLPIHPLMSREEVLAYIANGVPLGEIMRRGTGHPGQVLKVYDYHGTNLATDNLLDNLLGTMRDMAGALCATLYSTVPTRPFFSKTRRRKQ